MKNKIMYTLIFIASFSFGYSHAQTEFCHSIERCRYEIEKREADLAYLLNLENGIVPEFSEILATGITYREASNICSKNGMRLPTVKELALYAQSLGAQGVSKEIKEGYRVVNSYRGRSYQRFYYSSIGYQQPEGELGKKWFWSSSVQISHPPYRSYVLDGETGKLQRYYRDDNSEKNAVFCVISQT